MYDADQHHLPDDPPVRLWQWITEGPLDLTQPPAETGLDAAGWAAVRAHDGLWVNGHPGLDAAEAGSRIQVYAYAQPPPALDALPLKILLNRDGVVAVDKPAGLSTQRTRASALRCLQALLVERLGDPGLRAVHRLDRGTSGVVLFARDRASTAALHAQFRRRTVEKRYRALVSPAPAEDSFTVSAALGRIPGAGPRPAHLRMGVGDGPDARPSETHFKVLGRREARAAVEAHPVTGRTHQIRVHLAHVGCPILGDELYGDAHSAPRLMLHAARLTVTIGGMPTVLETPAPAGFSLWRRLD